MITETAIELPTVVAPDIADQDIAQQLILLTIEVTRRGLAHAFVDYAGHCDSISVLVSPIDTVYEEGAMRLHWLNEHIYCGHTPDRKRLLDAIRRLEWLLQNNHVVTIAAVLQRTAA
jgi:hypothetical protein